MTLEEILKIRVLVVPGFGSSANKTRTWTGNTHGRRLGQFLLGIQSEKEIFFAVDKRDK